MINSINKTTSLVIVLILSKEVLEATGFQHREIAPSDAEVKGSGVWVGISRDPETGELKAASDLRNNGAAVAY